MAVRSVFSARTEYPFFEEIEVNFDFFRGFALSQKRLSEVSLHQNYKTAYNEQTLEVSSASTSPLGYWLSAMHLNKRCTLGVTSVESVFQSARIYMDGTRQIGPFPEYLMLPGKEAKKLVKEAAGNLHSYRYQMYNGQVFPSPEFHISLYYDYVYITALLEPENRNVFHKLINSRCTAFSDLATRSLNSQARSCAIAIGLYKAGLLNQVLEYGSYMRLMRTDPKNHAPLPGAYEHVQLLHGDRVELFSPAVLKTFTEEMTKEYFNEHYSHLNNSPKFVPQLE